jgi:adenine phosphoribosyltransferase
MGAEVIAACFVIDLPELGGRASSEALDVAVRTLVAFRALRVNGE